jgi:hypothetical protein
MLRCGPDKEKCANLAREPLPMHAVYPSFRFIPARAKTFISFVDQRIKTTPGMM